MIAAVSTNPEVGTIGAACACAPNMPPSRLQALAKPCARKNTQVTLTSA